MVTSLYLQLDLRRRQTYQFKHTNWFHPKKMSLEALTDNIVQLCEECNDWSSTINIPHGNGDILDISAACGSQASTPKGAEIYPDECPKGLHGSYYTFDPSVYGEHSRPDLKSMLTTPECVSGCNLVVRVSKGPTHCRKASHCDTLFVVFTFSYH